MNQLLLSAPALTKTYALLKDTICNKKSKLARKQLPTKLKQISRTSITKTICEELQP